MSAEEPSYLMFARANVRDNMATSPTVVRELLARIDRDAAALKAAGTAAPRTLNNAQEMDALPVGSVVLDLSGDAWRKQTSGWAMFDGSDPELSLTVLWQGIEGPSVTVLHEAQA